MEEQEVARIKELVLLLLTFERDSNEAEEIDHQDLADLLTEVTGQLQLLVGPVTLPLKSQTNTTEVRDEIDSLVAWEVRQFFGDDVTSDVFFEHDSWWVRFDGIDGDEPTLTFSVVDTDRGLDLELVS